MYPSLSNSLGRYIFHISTKYLQSTGYLTKIKRGFNDLFLIKSNYLSSEISYLDVVQANETSGRISTGTAISPRGMAMGGKEAVFSTP